jgi:hypothetical protein
MKRGISMTHLSPTEITRKRVAKWVMETQPVTASTVWTETRLAIDFGGHTYLIQDGQIFQCAHCGHYDPEWKASEVLTFFRDNFGIKPYEIQVNCSVAIASKES